ncbi:MAG: hypothetical protein F4X44_12300 [Gammaproteobacteria bacterium]|nr:hypothetical protein [Gammaproteobacteria bacterium]
MTTPTEPQLIPVANPGICPITGEPVNGKAIAVVLVDARGDGQTFTAFPVSRRYVKERTKRMLEKARSQAKEAK